MRSWSWFVLILALSWIFLVGCDQKVPLEFTSTLNISGTVYEYDYLRNTSNREKKLDQVFITLSGTATFSTTTSSNGAFSFASIPLGKYTLAATKEGYQKDGKPAYTAEYDLSPAGYAGTSQTIEFDLDPRPVLLGASVDDNDEVSISTNTFRLYFSEAISPNSATAFVKMVGLRSAALDADSIVRSNISWESGGKTMVLTLGGSLEPDADYHLGLACSNAVIGIKGIMDLQNNPIYGTQAYDYSLQGLTSDASWGTYFYIPFKTEAGKTSRPSAPTGLWVRSTVTGSSEIDYNSVYSSGSGVTLGFNGSEGANGYKLYASRDGVNYLFVKQFGSPSCFVGVNDIVLTFGPSIAIGYDTYGYPVDPGLPWPFLRDKIYFKVSAYNSLGESDLSAPLSVVDTVKPTANAVAVSESPIIKIIKFSEPLSRETAENAANYIFQGVGTPSISSITLVNDFAFYYLPYKTTFIRLQIASPESGPRTIRIGGIKDLTGNIISAETEVTY